MAIIAVVPAVVLGHYVVDLPPDQASSGSSLRSSSRASPDSPGKVAAKLPQPLAGFARLSPGVVSAALRELPPGFLRGVVASQVCGEIEDGLLTECVDHFPESSCKFFTVFLREQLAQFSSQLVCATWVASPGLPQESPPPFASFPQAFSQESSGHRRTLSFSARLRQVSEGPWGNRGRLGGDFGAKPCYKKIS